jgi:hypothetical protein
VTLALLDPAGQPIRNFATAARQGLNRFVWDLRYPDAVDPPAGTVLFGGSTRGPLAPPGRYAVRLDVDGRTATQPLDIRRDPRLSTTDADLQQQFDLLIRIRDRVTATHDAANRILAIRARLARLGEASSRARGISDAAQALDAELASILDALVQMKIRSGNDVLSYPIRLNNQIASVGSVVAGGEARPTDQAVAAFRELTTALDAELARLNAALDAPLTRLNEQLKIAGQPPIDPGGGHR